MGNKIKSVLRGMFRYNRTPAAAIDGGANEYVFQQFQELPPQNVLAGYGWIPRQSLQLTSPSLLVFAPTSLPYDVTKVPVGLPDIEAVMIEEDILP